MLALTAPLPSRSLESDVIKALSRHRSSQGMTFTVDERLGYLLSPALAAYEAERVQGAPYCPAPPHQHRNSHSDQLCRYGNAEFQSSIRRFVPEGHTFKAFPFSTIHSNAQAAFDALSARIFMPSRGQQRQRPPFSARSTGFAAYATVGSR